MKQVVPVVLVGGLLCGCIDRTPGLEATLESASVTIEGADATQVVTVDIDLRVHVGKYALAGRNFIVPEANLLAQEMLAAEVSLDRPVGFDGMLMPGQTESYQTTGMTLVGGFPQARGLVCPAGPVQVVLIWTAMIATEDIDMPFRMEMGTADLITTDVTCL